jgi:hypothetical protein
LLLRTVTFITSGREKGTHLLLKKCFLLRCCGLRGEREQPQAKCSAIPATGKGITSRSHTNTRLMVGKDSKRETSLYHAAVKITKQTGRRKGKLQIRREEAGAAIAEALPQRAAVDIG